MSGGVVGTLRGLRAIVRMEIRELFRHRGRSLLILALVAIPVAAIVGGTSLIKITTPTDEERQFRAMGLATLRVEAPFEFAERKKILDALPADSVVQSWRETGEIVRVSGRQLRAKTFVLGGSPWPDRPVGLAEGTHLILEGELPRHAGEVALSPILLQGLAKSTGDVVRLEYGGDRTIVGIVAEPEELDSPLVLRTAAAVEHGGAGYLLIGLEDPQLESTVAANLRELGFTVEERSSIAGEGGELAWALFVLGTIGFLEAGLVVASTFIVGLRRRQYEIGLLGSTGATGNKITLSLLASTGALAVPGVWIGAAAGAGAAASLMPFLDGWNRRLNGSLELAWGTVIAALVLGVAAALAATVVPAWAAGRMPIREALGGRRPIKTPSVVWLGLGLGMVGLGLAMVLLAPREMALLGALAAIVGSVFGVLGFGVCSPFFLDFLGRRAGRLPLRWRLAVRDAGRFRARNGPVVTAVLAGMAMSVTVAIFVASLDRTFDALPASLRTDQVLIAGPDAERVAARLAEELPIQSMAPLMAAYFHGEPVRVQRSDDPLPNPSRQWIAVGDEQTLRTVGAEAARDDLERGLLIQLRPASGGLLEMMGIKPESTETTTTFTTWRDETSLDPLSMAETTVDQNVMSPAYVLHRSKLEQLGWQEGPPIDRSMAPWLIRFDGPVTAELLAHAETAAGDAVGVTVDAQRLRNPARGFYHIVQWLCIFTGLVVVLVATALSSVESAADSRVLRTVGASPGLIRGHQAARAAYLAFLGCALAIPAGMTPAIVVFEATNLPLDLVIPWFDLAIALFALPALAYLGTWLVYREPRSAKAKVNPAVRAAALAVLSIGLGLAAPTVMAAPGETVGEGVTVVRKEIRWEAFEGEALDGSPLAGELGRLSVPVRHADPGGATMEIAFVRYRTSHQSPGPPIFYLAGGPGGSGTDHGGGVATHPQMRLLEYADVIGIDQRGTGLSLPALKTPEELQLQLPLDREATREETISALRRAASDTAEYWNRRGIDPRNYNTRESADDIDAVREALGLERIALYGASYGSHLGLAYLRRHPERVARAVLTKVEGPDHTWKLPSTVQSHLESLHRRCLEDPRVRQAIPDLMGTIASLLLELRRQPVEVDGVVVGALDLQNYLSNALSESPTVSEIPGNVLSFSRGDWSALAETARENRRLEIPLMPWAMDCASGASPSRRERLRLERADRKFVLGDAILMPLFPEVCDSCVDCDLGDEFRTAFTSDVPVLFASGSYDVRTPPSNVEELVSGFSNATRILVEGAGHESRELMSPEFRAMLQGFLLGEAPAAATVTLPPILFQVPEELPEP